MYYIKDVANLKMLQAWRCRQAFAPILYGNANRPI